MHYLSVRLVTTRPISLMMVRRLLKTTMKHVTVASRKFWCFFWIHPALYPFHRIPPEFKVLCHLHGGSFQKWSISWSKWWPDLIVLSYSHSLNRISWSMVSAMIPNMKWVITLVVPLTRAMRPPNSYLSLQLTRPNLYLKNYN